MCMYDLPCANTLAPGEYTFTRAQPETLAWAERVAVRNRSDSSSVFLLASFSTWPTNSHIHTSIHTRNFIYRILIHTYLRTHTYTIILFYPYDKNRTYIHTYIHTYILNINIMHTYIHPYSAQSQSPSPSYLSPSYSPRYPSKQRPIAGSSVGCLQWLARTIPRPPGAPTAGCCTEWPPTRSNSETWPTLHCRNLNTYTKISMKFYIGSSYIETIHTYR